jgi:hypothetical protein
VPKSYGRMVGICQTLLATAALDVAGSLWLVQDFLVAIRMMLFYTAAVSAREPTSVIVLSQFASKIELA